MKCQRILRYLGELLWYQFYDFFSHFQDSERAVTREEGIALAQEYKCSFYECSARTRENVLPSFEDLTRKVCTHTLETNLPL